MQHYSSNVLSLLTVILMKAAVTRQAISSRDFLQVSSPCILYSLILKQTALPRPLLLFRSSKEQKVLTGNSQRSSCQGLLTTQPLLQTLHWQNNKIWFWHPQTDLQEQTRCLEHNLEYIQAVTQLQGLSSSLPCLQSVLPSLMQYGYFGASFS